MSETIFGEIVDWWNSEHNGETTDSFTSSLEKALVALGIMSQEETFLERKILTNWYQDTEETYTAVGAVELEREDRVRTVLIAAYASITFAQPPSEQVKRWEQLMATLSAHGVNVPHWYLVWKAAVYLEYPQHGLIDYLNKYPLAGSETDNLVQQLRNLLVGLAELRLQPLGLAGSLRTDSFKVYYCAFGFDTGDSTIMSFADCLKEFEDELLPLFPDSFRVRYLELSNRI